MNTLLRITLSNDDLIRIHQTENPFGVFFSEKTAKSFFIHNILCCFLKLSDTTRRNDKIFISFRVFCIWKYILVFPYEKEKEI